MANRGGQAGRFIARIAGALVGAGGTYAVLRLTGAWGLGDGFVIGVSAAMGLFGLLLGPSVWRAVIDLA
jgi:hypothetical protein